MSNRLAQESSPYLQQHADNPVDWYPWVPEAFAEAERRGVPVLLSIGYSTCHWCHVMAHESFEDEATAQFMNGHFVNVKVDREERPDVDAVYMAATQAMTGHGGWPMTVFLTPDARPFYAGTYFPPREGLGLPSFARVMGSVTSAWQEKREQLLGNAEALTAHIREASRPARSGEALPPGAPARAAALSERAYDPEYGGFGRAPKFPAPTHLDFLLTQPQRDLALATLRQMLAGGIYDQLGGGFHRYSVDAQWLVPHFEKMLYDNAQLTRTLLRAYQLSGDEAFARAARQTLDYLLREMRAPAEPGDAGGGFYSAQDADTPTEHGGVEGLTFTWTPAEFWEVLGEDADFALAHFGVSEAGNFRDPHRPEYGSRSVLSVRRPGGQGGESQPADAERLERVRARLLAARDARPQPGTDAKRLTSWNGLALAAFADAARILGDTDYLEVARQTAGFLRTMRREDGTLWHSFMAGRASVTGLLEDHALTGLGLVALYQAGGDPADLEWARELWTIIRRDFWDEDAGLFWSSGAGAEELLTRQAQFFDAAILSDTAAAALLGLWVSRYFGDEDAGATARRAVQTFSAEMNAAPTGLGGLWQAAAFLEAPPTEVVLVGTPAERAPLEREVARHFLPFTALSPGEAGTPLPLFEGRPGGGQAYVCRDRTCALPTSDPATLALQLRVLVGAGEGGVAPG